MQWLRNFITAINVVKILVGLAATGGGAMTLSLLSEIPWYQAVLAGAVLTASLVTIIVGLDHLVTKYTFKKKIVAHQLTVVAVREENGVRGVQLFIMFKNTGVREVWFKIDRLVCQIDKIGHDRFETTPEPRAIQPENSGGTSIPVILNLPTNKQEYEGFVETDVKYGKAKDKVSNTYKTNANFRLSIMRMPTGNLVGGIQMTGGRGSYE